MTQSPEMPERIWAKQTGEFLAGIECGAWADAQMTPEFETAYRRADLPPTDAECLRNEKVQALIEAARKTRGEIDRWVTVNGSTYDQLSAAIAALEQESIRER